MDAGAIPALLRTFAMGIPELQAHLKAGPVVFTPDIAAPSPGATDDLMDAATAAESARLDPCRYLQVGATCPAATQIEARLPSPQMSRQISGNAHHGLEFRRHHI